MRRVWAAVLSVWATIAIVGALAWTHAPAQTVAQGTQVVLLPSGTAVHAVTGSSPTAGGGATQLVTQNGAVVVASTTAQPHATTHSS